MEREKDYVDYEEKGKRVTYIQEYFQKLSEVPHFLRTSVKSTGVG